MATVVSDDMIILEGGVLHLLMNRLWTTFDATSSPLISTLYTSVHLPNAPFTLEISLPPLITVTLKPVFWSNTGKVYTCHQCPLSLVEFYGPQWKSMKLNGPPSNSMVIHVY